MAAAIFTAILDLPRRSLPDLDLGAGRLDQFDKARTARNFVRRLEHRACAASLADAT